ncbi:MAG: rhodanese-like domain-containing protein [Chitinivibrionales bacterium]|nr:rhodanese-like domain-containing protein [Chitinivibrionales bacterium]
MKRRDAKQRVLQRNKTSAFCALVRVFACALCSVVCAREAASDSGKAQKMLDMYAEYKKDAYPDAPDITVDSLLTLKERADVVIVDAREKKEMKVSMIPGAISQKQFEKDRDRYANCAVIAYCTIGYRSGEYVGKLRERGIEAYNLIGSALAWAHKGKQFVDSKGDTTKSLHVYGKKWDLAPYGYETVW